MYIYSADDSTVFPNYFGFAEPCVFVEFLLVTIQ